MEKKTKLKEYKIIVFCSEWGSCTVIAENEKEAREKFYDGLYTIFDYTSEGQDLDWKIDEIEEMGIYEE